MIYTVDNTVGVGRRVKRVIDAAGRQWTRVIECDTDSGWIERFQTTSGNHIIVHHNEAQREGFMAPAPLIVEFE
jgi:hypothetical protein